MAIDRDYEDTEIITNPIAVRAKLRELGIAQETLDEIFQIGLTARFSCTKNHPVGAPGYYQWAEMVSAAGDKLGKKGWTREDYKNFSTILRGDHLVAIAFVRGDEGTGNSTCEVTTKYPKGAATREAVTLNRLNLNLPLDERYTAENERRTVRIATYFVLQARQGNEWHFELSLPKSIDKKGYVESWQVRIILPHIELQPTPSRRTGNGPVESDVPVKRRNVG